MPKWGLIGIDGGATKVNAWEIEYHEQNFCLGSCQLEMTYQETPGFRKFQPVPLQQQFQEQRQGQLCLSPAEKEQGAVMVQTARTVIKQLAQQRGWQQVLIGMGMPGIKTPDQRGIVILANGPRIPYYAEELEKGLQQDRLQLLAPVQLASDADLCALGEEYACGGLFQGVTNAYYLGPGTGIADAMKLKGQIVPFDQASTWICKTWQMKEPGPHGHRLEDIISMRGIQERYQQQSKNGKVTIAEMAQRAVQGETAALQTLHATADCLAHLLFERITTLALGWQGQWEVLSKNPLAPHHPYQGECWQRLIVGQRLGAFMQTVLGQECLYKPIAATLACMIAQEPSLAAYRPNYLQSNGDLRSGLLCVSTLRDAPALGAGIQAYLHYQQKG